MWIRLTHKLLGQPLQMANTNPNSSRPSGKGYNQNQQIVYGYSLVKGKSKHPMEDYHVSEFRKVRDRELGLFAIYDGHLGQSVAEYLQSNLFDNILKEVGSTYGALFPILRSSW